MGVSTKRQRRIVVNDRVFFWCVKDDNKDDDRLYLVIKSDDKKFIVSYMLDQRNRGRPFSPKSPLIIVKGQEFKGVDDLGHSWGRFLVPDWEDKIVTPSLVSQIIEWCLKEEDVMPVDHDGSVAR